MRRTLLSILALALFAALPAVAGEAPSGQATVTAPTAALAAPPCQLDLASPFAGLAPAAPAEPEWMTLSGVSSRKFHGFCRCGCSSRPDCNTDADCGGGIGSCSQFISCC